MGKGWRVLIGEIIRSRDDYIIDRYVGVYEINNNLY